jgi:hypothetical protein
LPVYDFGSVTGAGPNFGATVTHAGTTATDTGVSFTFSSNGPSGFGAAISYDGGGAAVFVGTGETATLMIVDPDPSQQSLTDVVLQFSGFFDNTSGGAVAGDLQVRLENTQVSGQTTTLTLTGSQSYFANGSNYISIPAPAGAYNKITFLTNNPGSDFLYLHAISGNPQCFVTGTAISTPNGQTAVENLQPGDLVSLSDGGVTVVKWVGQKRIDTRAADPSLINPICITKGALVENVPSHDLYVSSDHAIEVLGCLINAGALVNGSSIYRVTEMPGDGFTYYHVETERHEVILAEGCPVESFLDTQAFSSFDNEESRPRPNPIQEMDAPRITSKRLVPPRILNHVAERTNINAVACPTKAA